MGNHQSESLRLATWEDRDICLPMFEKFCNNSPYRNKIFDKEKIAEIFHLIVTGDKTHGIAIYAPNKGILVGMVTELLMNRSRIASELCFWIEPEYRKSKLAKQLSEAYEYWARKIGCSYLQLTALDDKNYHRIHKLYERNGYKLFEHNYLKELK